MRAAARQSPGDSFLGTMARRSRERVGEAKRRESEAALLARALAAPSAPPFSLGRFGLIAELKYRSPAAGALAARGFDADGQVRAYAAGGATAVSVLTEPDEFHGGLDHLRQAAGLLTEHRIPAMRKDFLTDPYQVLEARAAGAGGVLLIVAMLGDAEIGELLACAAQCGLFVLLEAFDEADLERIGGVEAPSGGASRPAGPPHGTVPPPAPPSPHSSGLLDDAVPPGRSVSSIGPAPLLCGVNCRDLRDLSVDRDRFRQLAPHLPRHLPAVAESGLDGADDIATVASLGYGAALVGSALMRAADASRELAAMTAAGAQARRGGDAGGATPDTKGGEAGRAGQTVRDKPGGPSHERQAASGHPHEACHKRQAVGGEPCS